MAAKKDNQPSRVELPEKEWFSLEEIAERWGCSVDDLLHYGLTDKLQICYLFIRILIKWDGIGDYELARGPLAIGYQTLRSLIAGDTTRPYRVYPARGTAEDVFEFAEVAFHPDSGRPNTEDMTLSGLVIMRDERDRFEREYRIGAHAGTMPSKAEMEDRLDPRKEKTYLQIIRALVKAAELPGEPFKAASVLQAMAAQHGLSLPSKADTIAEKIKAAITLED